MEYSFMYLAINWFCKLKRRLGPCAPSYYILKIYFLLNAERKMCLLSPAIEPGTFGHMYMFYMHVQIYTLMCRKKAAYVGSINEEACSKWVSIWCFPKYEFQFFLGVE